MKHFALLLILLIFFPIAEATTEKINGYEVKWGSGTDYTLSWDNPQISKGGYIIRVIDFDWMGQASVSVIREGSTQHGILSQGENIIFDFTAKNSTIFQGVKISANKVSKYEQVNTSLGPNSTLPVNIGTFPCCPQAEITVEIPDITLKKPELEMVLAPNWDGRSGYTSIVYIELKNTGDASFSEGNITVNISGLKIADERELSNNALTYNPSKGTITRGWLTPLLADNSYYLNLSLKSPVPSNQSTFTIRVDSYFKDSDGNIYSASGSSTLKILDTLKFEKKVTALTILGAKTFREIEKFLSLGNSTVVNIYITNQQGYPLKSVILTDTVIKDFRLIGDTPSPKKDFRLMDNNTKLQWVFDINASEKKEFRYEMNAQKTGSFTAPAAVATWNEWGIAKTQTSDQPTTRVYGVFVVVSKKTNRTSMSMNQSLNVVTRLENVGDFPVGINVTDILPKNATFISGITAFSGYLYPKSYGFFSYNLSAESLGVLEFPSPHVTFWKKEYEGSYGFIPADIISVIEPLAVLQINVTNISRNITPAPTETPLPKSLLDIIGEKAPWLEGTIPVVMLFIAIVLMLLLHILNR